MDMLLMMLASSRVIHAYIHRPSDLVPAYRTFLNKHGGYPRKVVDAIDAVFHKPRPFPAAVMQALNADRTHNHMRSITSLLKNPMMKLLSPGKPQHIVYVEGADVDVGGRVLGCVCVVLSRSFVRLVPPQPSSQPTSLDANPSSTFNKYIPVF